MISLTPKQLRKAADIQEKIQSLQQKLEKLLGSTDEPTTTEKPRKRRVSAASKAKMAAAQKKRWAKVKGTTAVKGPKRKMSAAQKAKLSKMATERWKKVKAQGKKKL